MGGARAARRGGRGGSDEVYCAGYGSVRFRASQHSGFPEQHFHEGLRRARFDMGVKLAFS